MRTSFVLELHGEWSELPMGTLASGHSRDYWHGG